MQVDENWRKFATCQLGESDAGGQLAATAGWVRLGGSGGRSAGACSHQPVTVMEWCSHLKPDRQPICMYSLESVCMPCRMC